MSERIVSVPHSLPTIRIFGWFFAAVFAVVATYAYWKGWNTLALIALLSASLFSAATIYAPQMLAPLNRLWYGFGMLLGKIVSPIVLGVIFFILITPVSIVTRFFGRDELKVKKRYVKSYWIDRSPPGPPSDSFNNQY
jgi:hypothetical protein